MLEKVIMCVLILVAPFLIHCKAGVGSILPAPIKSGVTVFDGAYNRWPWLPSVACGIFGATAFAVEGYSEPAFVVCASIAASLFFIDTIGLSLAMWARLSKRR